LFLLWLVVLAGVAFILYMVKVAFENNIKNEEVKLNGNHDDTFAIFFISDVHNRVINPKMIKKMKPVEAVVIGGDFCDSRTSEKKLIENIRVLQQLGPIYFIWGNNDREVGETKLREIFRLHNITIVENDAVSLSNRKNCTWISAIDDYGTKNSNFQKALQKCGKDDIIICISHNPQVFDMALQYAKPSLFLGGHLHGGQIRFGPFGIHPKGSFKVRNGIATLISNGYGTTLLPFRLGAHPEVHRVEIKVENVENLY